MCASLATEAEPALGLGSLLLNLGIELVDLLQCVRLCFLCVSLGIGRRPLQLGLGLVALLTRSG